MVFLLSPKILYGGRA